jgi:hypothetical protein
MQAYAAGNLLGGPGDDSDSELSDSFELEVGEGSPVSQMRASEG